MGKVPTPESLRRDRERRERERKRLAEEFEAAARLLSLNDDFRHAAAHLRAEARRWAQ